MLCTKWCTQLFHNFLTNEGVRSMKNLIRLTDMQLSEIYKIFNIADEINAGKYSDFLKGKSVVLFFTNSKL